MGKIADKPIVPVGYYLILHAFIPLTRSVSDCRCLLYMSNSNVVFYFRHCWRWPSCRTASSRSSSASTTIGNERPASVWAWVCLCSPVSAPWSITEVRSRVTSLIGYVLPAMCWICSTIICESDFSGRASHKVNVSAEQFETRSKGARGEGSFKVRYISVSLICRLLFNMIMLTGTIFSRSYFGIELEPRGSAPPQPKQTVVRTPAEMLANNVVMRINVRYFTSDYLKLICWLLMLSHFRSRPVKSLSMRTWESPQEVSSMSLYFSVSYVWWIYVLFQS